MGLSRFSLLHTVLHSCHKKKNAYKVFDNTSPYIGPETTPLVDVFTAIHILGSLNSFE